MPVRVNTDIDTNLEVIPNTEVSQQDHSSSSGKEYNPELDKNQYSVSDDDFHTTDQTLCGLGGLGLTSTCHHLYIIFLILRVMTNHSQSSHHQLLIVIGLGFTVLNHQLI